MGLELREQTQVLRKVGTFGVLGWMLRRTGHA